jgi:acyl-CoA synthetase (AMP-forming)/AMP-acid ligase II
VELKLDTRPATRGQLLVRTPSRAVGVIGDDADTQPADAGRIESEWIETGDLAAIDADGHVRITGRLVDTLVLSGGTKVPPAEVEAALAEDPVVARFLRRLEAFDAHAVGQQRDAVGDFEIIIQGGAILAVLGLYRARIGQMVRGTVSRLGVGGLGLTDRMQAGWKIARNVVSAFLPAAAVGFLAKDTVKAHLFNPASVVGALIVGGLVMLAIAPWQSRRLAADRDAALRAATTAALTGSGGSPMAKAETSAAADSNPVSTDDALLTGRHGIHQLFGRVHAFLRQRLGQIGKTGGAPALQIVLEPFQGRLRVFFR